MDPVQPWIDADEVRRLAVQLLKRNDPPPVADRSDAGFGPSFEGFVRNDHVGAGTGHPAPPEADPSGVAGEPTAASEAFHPAPVAAAPPEAKPAGTTGRHHDDPARPFFPSAELPKPAAEQQVEPPAGSGSEIRRGRLLSRFEAFRSWLLRQSGGHGAFILDRDGNPVLDDPKYAKLHFLARSLAQAYRPVAGQAGNVHVKVGSDLYLVVVPANTVFGTLVLGAVLSRPLSAAAVEVTAKALGEAARPGQAGHAGESS